MPIDAARAKSLFLSASDLVDPAERAAFLNRECGDDVELRARVEALLRANDAAPLMVRGDVTQTHLPSGTDRTEDYHDPKAFIGQVLAGKYKLMEVIGEGGMGSVWLAQQSEPVKRKVAVKLIKAGMDSKQVLAAFEAERQALAMMDHPNIAKVFDGGIVNDQAQGRTSLGFCPFFVMELVKGVPITEYCDARKLTPKERLELFVPVCQAIQHAHQKGIIHRDIKPSNVLIALYDDKPVAKVIDFGVAKATGGTLTEHTIDTGFGGVVGTPQYMSPEQATLNNLDIDTRSDVYSLGVLLYELLTGSPPFSRKDLEKKGLLEILRVVREEEPPRPSTKLSTADALPSLSASRGTEPKKLTGLLRNELDWIVMKALEKDRTRRYETANGFATDVQRYLSGEAVQAHPPSRAYRVKKFVRRNRGQVIAASLVLFVLLAGIAGTTFGLFRAETRRVEAEKAQADEAAQRKRAEQAEDDTLTSYQASTDEVVEQVIGAKPELGPAERAYLENTLKRWQRFADRTDDDRRSLTIRAEGHYRVGLTWMRLGRTTESVREYESALRLYQVLTSRFPDADETKHKLAICYNQLGAILATLNQSEPARAHFLSAHELFDALSNHEPANPQYLLGRAQACRNLGNWFADRGQREAAQEEFQQAAKVLATIPGPASKDPRYRCELAAVHSDSGRHAARHREWEVARREFRAAIEITKSLTEEYPGAIRYLESMTGLRSNLGLMHSELGDPVSARTEFLAAKEVSSQLVDENPAIPQFRHQLAVVCLNNGKILVDLGRPAEARTEFQAARDLFQTLTVQHPDDPGYRWSLSSSQNNLGGLLMNMGEAPAALAEFRAAIDQRKELVVRFPDIIKYPIALSASYRSYGFVLLRDGKPAESLSWFDKAVETVKPARADQPLDAATSEVLSHTYSNRAQAHQRLKNYAAAIDDWGRAIERSTPAKQLEFRERRVNSQLRLGRLAEAVAEVDELTKTPGANATGLANWNAGQWYNFACVYAIASGKIATQKQEYADRAMAMLRRAVKAGYKDAAHMKKDADLDALREREDFKKLLAELEKKAEKK